MTDADITALYSGPIQGGGDLPYFVGKQYGNGWLRTLGRFAFPILRRILGVAMNTGEDIVTKKKDWKTSLKDNATAEVKNFMQGRGRRKRPAASSINKSDPPSSIFACKRQRKQ